MASLFLFGTKEHGTGRETGYTDDRLQLAVRQNDYGVSDLIFFDPRCNEVNWLISHADDDQSLRIFPNIVQVRDLAKARASPSAEDLDQYGATFHVLGAQGRRVQPGGIFELGHRALRRGGRSSRKGKRGAASPSNSASEFVLGNRSLWG